MNSSFSETPEIDKANAQYIFRLYVATDALNGAQALANLTALCDSHLPGRHEIHVVDVFKEPKRALADGILVTPTLIKMAPKPPRQIVGTLSQTKAVLLALDVKPLAA